MNKSHTEGLYGKYNIAMVDGSPVDPNSMYFILRIDNDPDALLAAMLWAISKNNWVLLNDLKQWRK